MGRKRAYKITWKYQNPFINWIFVIFLCQKISNFTNFGQYYYLFPITNDQHKVMMTLNKVWQKSSNTPPVGPLCMRLKMTKLDHSRLKTRALANILIWLNQNRKQFISEWAEGELRGKAAIENTSSLSEPKANSEERQQ